HTPRPYVPAARMLEAGIVCRSLTTVFGRYRPNNVHCVPRSFDAYTPRAVPAYSTVGAFQSAQMELINRFFGMLPQMLFHWPLAGSRSQIFFPAPPVVTANTRLAFAGSIRMSTTNPAFTPKSPPSFCCQDWPPFVVVQTC